jgi:lipopolysaccharide transport system ATP-binding protein
LLHGQAIFGFRKQEKDLLMFSDNIAIRVENVSKCFEIYDNPSNRLKQFILPRLSRLFRKAPKKYYREFWALKDISFEIKKGETIGIFGLNGSGKSTLLQIICGTLNPTLGNVETNGRIAALLELGSGFNPEFTGRENVFLNGTLLGLSHEEVETKFEAITEFADIGEFIDQPVKTYSSGMIVRLAFAVSISVEPDILVVDEALAVGDAAFQFKCLERLEQLTKSGVTLIFVSHDIQMVKSFCSRAIYLKAGEVQAMGISHHLAELYLLDIRNEQAKSFSEKPISVNKKPSLGENDTISFGTNQGSIIRAEFIQTGLMHTIYNGDDKASLLIEAEYEKDLINPHITIIILNQKMIELGGRSFRIQAYEENGKLRKSHIHCTFPIIYGNGRYNITIKLESRSSDLLFFPIDKQVGILSFEVLRPSIDFQGFIDLGIEKILQ